MTTATSSETTIDHGYTLTHDLAGDPLAFVHKVSVPYGTPPPAGYEWHVGWIRDGVQWLTYLTTIPATGMRYTVTFTRPDGTPDELRLRSAEITDTVLTALRGTEVAHSLAAA
jgi:hypothetical protein